MNTLNMSLGSGSVASSELIFWSGVLRGHYQEFSLCAFFSKGIFNPFKCNCLYCCSFKELQLWWSKAACAFCHVSIFMGEGDSISIVLGISGAKPRQQSFAEDKDSSSEMAPFPCYYAHAFLEREVPSTTKGAKVGKGKSPLDFKAASFFGALL